MKISTGMILLYAGIAVAVISVILLIIFLSSEKKKKIPVTEEMLEKKDTAVFAHKNKNQEFAETEVLEEKGNTETVLMGNEKTEIMKS